MRKPAFESSDEERYMKAVISEELGSKIAVLYRYADGARLGNLEELDE